MILHFLLLLNPIFIGINLGDVHWNWHSWFHFLISVGGPLVILNRFQYFTVTIPKCYKGAYVCQGFLCNPFHAECFSLTCDRHGFTSSVDRYLLSIYRFFLISFPEYLPSLPCSFSCNSVLCSICSALCGVNSKIPYIYI